MIHSSDVIGDANAILASKGLIGENTFWCSDEGEAVIIALCERFNKELTSIAEISAPKQERPNRDEAVREAIGIGLPSSEGHRFFDYYESNGWKVGKAPMKKWKSALANWKRTWDERHPQMGLAHAP